MSKAIAEGLQDKAARHAGMLAAFCNRIGWLDLEALITTFQSRVLHGVRTEMLDLMEIPRVKSYTARLLYKAGLKTPEDIAAVDDPMKIVQILSPGRSQMTQHETSDRLIHAQRVISGARRLLRQRAQSLQEEANHVLQVAGPPGPNSPQGSA